MTDLKNTIFLIVIVIVAFFSLKFSSYGLIVHLFNNKIYEVSIEEISSSDLFKNRYISIKNATSIDNPIELIDRSGQVQSYIYPLLEKTTISDSLLPIQSNILIETSWKIQNWEHTEIIGLLDPYWNSIDEELISELEYSDIKIDKRAYYMQVGTKPLKWYWYLLILLISVFYMYKLGGHLILKILNKKKATANNGEHP